MPSSIIKKLDASRRLESDLNLQRHQQELEKSKLDRQLEGLSRSRRNYIDSQLVQNQLTYEQKLREDITIAEEHLGRQKRATAERAKVAQLDFERERERLIKQRNSYDDFDKQNRVVDKAILDLKTRSKFANEDEDRAIVDLSNRRQVVLRLIEESRQRELYHYDNFKRLSAF